MNRVRETQMGELAAVAEPIDRGSRYLEAIRDLSDAQQALRCTPGDLKPTGVKWGTRGGHGRASRNVQRAFRSGAGGSSENRPACRALTSGEGRRS